MEFDQTHHKKLRAWYFIPAGYIDDKERLKEFAACAPFELIAFSLILFAECHGNAHVWDAATCADDDVIARGHTVPQFHGHLARHARYVARHILVTIWMVERSNMWVTCPIPAGAWLLNSLHSFFVLAFIVAIYSLLSSILSLCTISISVSSFKSLFITEHLVYDESLALCSQGTRFKSRLMSCLS
jgi:hypothetical protein